MKLKDLGRYEAAVIKYIARAKHKGKELEDLKKAQWYLGRLIKKLEAKESQAINDPVGCAGKCVYNPFCHHNGLNCETCCEICKKHLRNRKKEEAPPSSNAEKAACDNGALWFGVYDDVGRLMLVQKRKEDPPNLNAEKTDESTILPTCGCWRVRGRATPNKPAVAARCNDCGLFYAHYQE